LQQQEEKKAGENDVEQEEDEGDDDSLSEYRDENAEPDEVDECPSGTVAPLEHKVKKLRAHENNIKQIDKVLRYQSQAINLDIKDKEKQES
jgi:hypothetical protein